VNALGSTHQLAFSYLLFWIVENFINPEFVGKTVCDWLKSAADCDTLS